MPEPPWLNRQFLKIKIAAIHLSFKCHATKKIICKIFFTPITAVTTKTSEASNSTDLIGDKGGFMKNILSPCKRLSECTHLFSPCSEAYLPPLTHQPLKDNCLESFASHREGKINKEHLL